MKKALFMLFILALCLPAGCARPADPAPTEAPAASRYLALPWEEEVWSLAVLPETDTAEVGVSLTEADGFGCSFTLDNRGAESFVLYPEEKTGCHPLFRKTESGSWEWMKPLRMPENGSWSCGAGASASLGLDWSRELGPLEPGEYALLLTGGFRDRKGGWVGEPVSLPLRFTLGEDPLPEAPGPLTMLETPEQLTLEVKQLSTRRHIQTLTAQGDGSFVPDRDFFLFRAEEDGTLTYLQPRYRLPYVLNLPAAYGSGRPMELEIDLAAQYGTLQPGAYVVRRRLYRLEEGETLHVQEFDRSWRTLPEDRILWVDARLYVGVRGVRIPAPGREVEPMAAPYTGEEPMLPVILQNGSFTADGCRFSLLNRCEAELSFSGDEYTLYYLERNAEWLPLARERHVGSGLIPFTVLPGESKEWGTVFGRNQVYGALPRGSYRLVFFVHLGEDRKTEYPLAVSFSIGQDGSGTYTGLEQEVRAAVRAYRDRLAEAYVLPEPPADAPWYACLYGSALQTDCAHQWKVDMHKGTVRVTVYRDRDVERARAVLADFPSAEVVRGEDFPRRSSPVTEEKLGTLGVLTAEPVLQTDPELYREGTWLLTLEVTAEEAVWRSSGWCTNLFPEVWDRETEQWLAIPIPDLGYSAMGHAAVAMEPGMKLQVLVSLGVFHTEFSPEEEYRFVLESDAGPGTGAMQLEYYVCPFAVTMEGEA